MSIKNYTPDEKHSDLCRGCDFYNPEGMQESCSLFATGNTPVGRKEMEKYFIFVSRGFVQCSVSLDDGRQGILALYLHGDLLNSPCHILGQAVQMKGTGNASVVCVNKDTLNKILKRSGEALDTLESIYQMQSANHLMLRVINGPLTALEKVCAFLLFVVLRQGSSHKNLSQIDFEFDRETVGSLLGLSPETVSRCLTDLRQRNIVERPLRQRFVVRDILALCSLTPISDIYCSCEDDEKMSVASQKFDIRLQNLFQSLKSQVPENCPFDPGLNNDQHSDPVDGRFNNIAH